MLFILLAVLLIGCVPPIEPLVCTEEAKQCPDGSFVGRTGPNCAFEKCPTGVLPNAPYISLMADKEDSIVGEQISFTARLNNAEVLAPQFSCDDILWDYGDGHDLELIRECKGNNGNELQTLFQTKHRYEQQGEYDITFTLGQLTSTISISIN